MFRAFRNGWRLLRMALSFARHDALFPLETLGIAPALSKKALAKANVNRLYREIQAEKAREAREGADATHEE